jgi:hypothetical protein
MSSLRARFRNRWGKPRFLVVITWLYIVWAILPVLIAMLFSFNNGRSRSVWQGFSIRWWWGDPNLSIFHDPDYTHALVHSLDIGRVRHLDRGPVGRAARAGARSLARAWLSRRQWADARPVDHARDRHGGVAAAGVHPAGVRIVARPERLELLEQAHRATTAWSAWSSAPSTSAPPCR